MAGGLILPIGDFTINDVQLALPMGSVKSLFAQDSRRWGFILEASATAGVVQIWTAATFTGINGFQIGTGANRIMIMFRDYPGICNQGWFALAATGVGALWGKEIVYQPLSSESSPQNLPPEASFP